MREYRKRMKNAEMCVEDDEDAAEALQKALYSKFVTNYEKKRTGTPTKTAPAPGQGMPIGLDLLPSYHAAHFAYACCFA